MGGVGKKMLIEKIDFLCWVYKKMVFIENEIDKFLYIIYIYIYF